jgi:hypothetical protein
MASAPTHTQPSADVSNPAMSNFTILNRALDFCNVASENDGLVVARTF